LLGQGFRLPAGKAKICNYPVGESMAGRKRRDLGRIVLTIIVNKN